MKSPPRARATGAKAVIALASVAASLAGWTIFAENAPPAEASPPPTSLATPSPVGPASEPPVAHVVAPRLMTPPTARVITPKPHVRPRPRRPPPIVITRTSR
jgi:hypothetical protein